jgi:hypothetical protein
MHHCRWAFRVLVAIASCAQIGSLLHASLALNFRRIFSVYNRTAVKCWSKCYVVVLFLMHTFAFKFNCRCWRL